MEKGGVPEIRAVCVVSKARARRGKAFRMNPKALAMQKELRGREPACNRSNEEAAGVAGVGGWVRLRAGGRHGCLHGEGGCGLLCQARLGWWGWSLGVGFEDICDPRQSIKRAQGATGGS